MWTPDSIAKLQHASRANNYRTYKEYAQIINDQSRRHMTLRGLFEFRFDPSRAIPLDDVESAKDIVKRFATGAMSLGSISTEAHSVLATRCATAPKCAKARAPSRTATRWPRCWVPTASKPTSC
ncbi:hypothetical protein G6F31_019267 [Rhizopus arrhizus]|nr:hypothetical protein G6F31_019267 [Rhizopus arrhizus]